MAGEPNDLSALLERIRARDESALAELLQRYESQLRLTARILLGPALRTQLDSLDLVQSMHRVLLPGLRAGKYDISSLDKLLALARTIVRRKVFRNWRSLQCRQAAETAKIVEKPESEADGHADDPSLRAGAAELQQHILAGLTGLERQLIELRIQGYSTVEIAEQLNCDAHALRARLHRLRQRLRNDGFSEWL